MSNDFTFDIGISDTEHHLLSQQANPMTANRLLTFNARSIDHNTLVSQHNGTNHKNLQSGPLQLNFDTKYSF